VFTLATPSSFELSLTPRLTQVALSVSVARMSMTA
jgi:hypothetical protein